MDPLEPSSRARAGKAECEGIPEPRWVGQPLPRVDALKKVTGRARYVGATFR